MPLDYRAAATRILLQCPACGATTDVRRQEIGDARAMQCGTCKTSLGFQNSSATAAAWHSARAKALSQPRSVSALARRRRESLRDLGLRW